MIADIIALANQFIPDDLPSKEQVSLELLCQTSLNQWSRKLRADVAMEDCQGALTIACAFTALGLFLSAKEAIDPVVAFKAGDISARYDYKSKHAACEDLTSQAHSIMKPYIVDQNFAFVGVMSE